MNIDLRNKFIDLKAGTEIRLLLTNGERKTVLFFSSCLDDIVYYDKASDLVLLNSNPCPELDNFIKSHSINYEDIKAFEKIN